MKLDTIMCGHILDVTPQMPDGCVHCSCTSPPYYSLRKYAGEQQCDWPEVEYAPMSGLSPITVGAMTCALGHESTVEAYVGHLVAIYREVRRVLRDDGVAWVAMGDSYIGGKGKSGQASSAYQQERFDSGVSLTRPAVHLDKNVRPTDDRIAMHKMGLKPGDLMLIPHRLALALQADGWMVRNDVVWAKKAPMPESVRGWRWERHRIKVKRLRTQKQGYARAGNHRDKVHGNLENQPSAEWQPVPAVPSARPTAGTSCGAEAGGTREATNLCSCSPSRCSIGLTAKLQGNQTALPLADGAGIRAQRRR